jgi:hypothetical protein
MAGHAREKTDQAWLVDVQVKTFVRGQRTGWDFCRRRLGFTALRFVPNEPGVYLQTRGPRALARLADIVRAEQLPIVQAEELPIVQAEGQRERPENTRFPAGPARSLTA